MADFGIKPDIALGAAGPKRTNISDLIGTATKAMEYSRLSELYPELIKKTTAEAAAAKTGAEKAEMGFNLDKARTITDGQVSMMYNPLVVAAAQGKPVDRQALVNAVIDNAKVQSQNAGIDWETQGKKLAAPYIALAENNPEKLQGYFKERMIAGVDQATRASMMTPSPISGLPAPATFAPAEGVARPLGIQGQAPAPQSAPPQAAPAGQPSAAPRGVTPPDMTAPIRQQGGPGFPLRFPARPAGDIRPYAVGEETSMAEGKDYIAKASSFRSRAPANIDRVDRVLQTIDSIEQDRTFKAGKPGELEARLRAFLGDADYQLLKKEIADLVIETNQITGGKTDAASELVSRSTGNENYAPGVLKNIATKLRGDAYGAFLQAQGAERFLEKGYGEANLARSYRSAWDANADPRVFEAMAIFASDRLSPEAKMKAFDKIKPTTAEALNNFEKKLRNIQSLAETGTLPVAEKPKAKR